MNQINISQLAKNMTLFCQKQSVRLSASPQKQIILAVVVAAINDIDKIKSGIWESLPG